MSIARNGVNLGGWLVVEKWMTPSLFAGTVAKNEYELAATAEGRARLEKHHKTFIGEKDWQWLQKNGMTLVRIPVGYWIVDGDEPYVAARERLDWAFAMAAKYKIDILLDLHAAPGAQNDSDHSGSGAPHTGAQWLKSRSHQRETVARLETLLATYGTHPRLWGLQLLNEPAVGRLGLRLTWFYRRAYRAIVRSANVGTRVVFSDAYRPWLLTNTYGWLQNRDFPVVMDCHLYNCFGRKNSLRTFGQHLQVVKRRRHLLRVLGWQQPVLVGEWSGVLPYAVSDKETKEFIALQQTVYANALANFYWNYKTEHSDIWNFRAMHEKGLVALPAVNEV